MSPSDDTRVEHDEAGHRYVLRRGDQELGETVYKLREGVIDFVHTEIDPEIQERGLSTRLVTGALDQVRSDRTERVVETCPFVRRFLGEHPEYADLTTR